MSIYAIPALTCMIIMPILGLFILSQNSHSKIKKQFFVITLWISYWAFIEFNLRQSANFESALFWTRAGFLIPVTCGLYIHLVLLYIGKWDQMDRGKAILGTYAVPIIISFADLFTGAIFGTPAKKHCGWDVGQSNLPLVFYMYMFWIIIVSGYVFFKSWQYYKTVSGNKKKSTTLFFLTLIITVILGSGSFFTSVLTKYSLPEITIIIATIALAFFTYQIMKYDLFATPAEAAEDIIDIMADCMVLIGSNNEILRINRTVSELTGFSEKEIAGEDISILLSEAAKAMDTYKNKKTFRIETKLSCKDGRKIPVLLSGSAMLDSSGESYATVIVAKDQTYFNKTQEELARVEKLTSLELIASGFAHDFNNILTAIIGRISLARREKRNAEMVEKDIDAIEKAVTFATYLTRQLATFSQEPPYKKEPCSISEIIKESSELAFRGSPINIKFNFTSDLPLINADKYLMMRVFINLFINSRHAMPNGGNIVITCEKISRNRPSGDSETQDCIKIRISDDGCGIPQEHLEKIFTPFFTTKEKGSGLGLSIAKSIIQKHDGEIFVVSKEGFGTEFTLLIPAFADNVENPTGKIRCDNLQKKKILLMDDDAAVIEPLMLLLSMIGHDVITTRNGSDAIEEFIKSKSIGKPFDLVILDLTVVNGKGGQETIKRLLEIEPDTKAILSSGHINNPLIQNFRQIGFKGFISKPFSYDELINTMAMALGETTAS